MPELPEVETVRRGLSRLIVGKKIVHISNDNPKSFPNSRDEVGLFLINSSIIAVRRRAKVLMIDLDTQHTLVIHLKMTGQLVYVQEELTPPLVSEVNSEATLHPLKLGRRPRAGVDSEVRFGAGHPNDSLVGHLPDKSTRVTFDFDDGSKLFFNDQRKFGWVKLFPSLEVPNIDFMKRVGPEPLEDGLVPEQFIERIRRRNGTTIKAAILDQSVIAGVGNIYADESLWSSMIHPAQRVRDVDDKQLTRLLAEIQAVLRLSIEKGGSTDRNYIDAEGKRGSYLEFANVFRREGQACRRHPDVLIEKIRVAGRGTHVCLVCQVESDG